MLFEGFSWLSSPLHLLLSLILNLYIYACFGPTKGNLLEFVNFCSYLLFRSFPVNPLAIDPYDSRGWTIDFTIVSLILLFMWLLLPINEYSSFLTALILSVADFI